MHSGADSSCSQMANERRWFRSETPLGSMSAHTVREQILPATLARDRPSNTIDGWRSTIDASFDQTALDSVSPHTVGEQMPPGNTTHHFADSS